MDRDLDHAHRENVTIVSVVYLRIVPIVEIIGDGVLVYLSNAE